MENIQHYCSGIKDVLGIWSEEIDVLYDNDSNYISMEDDNSFALSGRYEAGVLCDLIHTTSADVLASYGKDFYAGRPALTVNQFGEGNAYYIASRNEDDFLTDFYKMIVKDMEIETVLDKELPSGVTATKRTDGENNYIFIMNYTSEDKEIHVNEKYKSLISDRVLEDKVKLEPFGIDIITLGK